MSEPIKAGDLVVMVRGHACLFAEIGGIPFIVTEVKASVGAMSCRRCGATRVPFAGIAFTASPHATQCALAWLQKIDPPAELSDERTGEELTA